MLLLVFGACALGAIALAVYSAVLIARRRQAPPAAAPPPAARPAVRLPGMPPAPAPSAWTAVDRKLETARAGRGSSPPRRLAASRFDDVVTSGLPVVPSAPRDRTFDDEDPDQPAR